VNSSIENCACVAVAVGAQYIYATNWGRRQSVSISILTRFQFSIRIRGVYVCGKQPQAIRTR
jgi:hypothetical protein